MGLELNTSDALEATETKSMEDTIAESWAEITSRGETDEPVEKVEASVEPVEAKSDTISEPAEPTSTETASTETAARPPSSWTSEAKAEFAKASPVIQNEIIRRENDFHTGIQDYKQYAQRGYAMEQAFQPYMATIQALNVTPEVAVTELFKADHALRHGNEGMKIQMALKIFKDYNIDASKVFDAISNGTQTTSQPDPAYTQLLEKVSRMESQQTQVVRDNTAREQAALNSEIAQFSAGKEHFETVREDMAALLQTGRATTLADAYEKAVRLNPVTFAAAQAKQLAAATQDKQRKATDAKKAASINITSRGVVHSKAAVGTMEDTIRAEASRLGLT